MIDRAEYHSSTSPVDYDFYRQWLRADGMKKRINDVCGQEKFNYPFYSWTRPEQEPKYGICDIVAYREVTTNIPSEINTAIASFPDYLTFIDGSRYQVCLR